jgi:hypothetical protein
MALGPENEGDDEDEPDKKPCRVDTIAALRGLQNEPNCLDSRF